MSARQQLVTDGAEAIADLTEQYRQAVSAVVALVQQGTGVDLTPAVRPSVMDATQGQLKDAAGRARQALAAMDTVLKVHWGEATTLGELLRDEFWSDEDRERIVDHLVKAGLS